MLIEETFERTSPRELEIFKMKSSSSNFFSFSTELRRYRKRKKEKEEREREQFFHFRKSKVSQWRWTSFAWKVNQSTSGRRTFRERVEREGEER